MPNTITGFTSFSPNTKAKSGEVNANFSNFRGTLLPINENTASAATSGTYDHGSSEHMWKDGFFQGLQMGITTTTLATITSDAVGGLDISLATTTGQLDIKVSGTTVTSIDSSGIAAAGVVGVQTDGILTAMILDAQVTNAKRPTLTVNESAGGTTSTSSVTYVDATNVGTVTITTTGRPVFVGLQNDSAASGSDVSLLNATATEDGRISIVRDSTKISEHSLYSEGSHVLRVPPGSVWHIDTPAAGTYTYKLQIRVTNAADEVGVSNALLVAVEL